MTFLRFFENFNFSIRNSSDDICMPLAWQVSSTSPSGGNQVDGLPPASSTETMAKMARLGSAENGKPMQKNIELSMFCPITLLKSHRICCRAYIEDRYGRD